MKCKAITTSGEQCTQDAEPKQEYCYFHQKVIDGHISTKDLFDGYKHRGADTMEV